MRFTSLALRNFMGFENVEIAPGVVNLVCGPNGAGKSTLAVEALRAVRYGTARGIQKKDAVLLSREGSGRPWEVAARVLADGAETHISRSGSKCSATTAQLDAIFKDQRVLEAVLEAGSFVRLSVEARRALVSDIVASDTSAIVERLKELGAPTDVVKAAGEGNLRGAHRRATEHRQEASAELKAALAALEAPETDPDIQIKDGATVKASTLDAKRLSAARAAATKSLQAATDYVLLLDTWQKAKAKAEAAGKALVEMDASVWSEEKAQALEKARGEVNRLTTALAGVAAALPLQMKALSNLEAAKNSGPTPCPTCRKPMVWDGPMETELAAVYGRIQSLKNDRNAASSSMEAARASLRALEDERQRAHDARARIADLQQQVAAGNAPEPQKPAKTAEECRAILERVAAAERAWGVWDASVRARASAKDGVTRLQERVQALEAVEEATSPDKAVGLDQALAAVNGFIAQHGHRLFGHANNELKPAVVLDSDWTPSIYGRAFGLCSTSERDRASLLVAAALSHISGLGLMVLDQVEHLDAQHQGELLRLARDLTASGALDQVWLAQVPAKAPDPLKVPSWLHLWWVEGGSVRRVEAAAAPASA